MRLRVFSESQGTEWRIIFVLLKFGVLQILDIFLW